ncbi:uncharacterized protein LOC124362044 [Homalodisca vitripennis]|uniref:uncharacterized protein LOC124362044 n=1 Tax=Homalodisca vitripennis TaxID=197043 RepID=UPI001EEC0FE2|nr:uncharacterized protein LOC124362044 [Homalodisca vitripennis]
MGIKTTKVRLLAAVFLLPLCAASLCPSGLQYWSTETESCVNCSRCDSAAKQVVIRPCQVHVDTVCGPLSDLNIDWSWLKPRDDKHKHAGKHHGKHLVETDDVTEKKHHKKGHKHHFLLDDDMEKFPIHHSVFDDEVEEFPPVTHHGHKHHKHDSPKLIDEGGLETDKKPAKKHHLFSKNLLSDDFDTIDHEKMHKLPPPPPLRSTEDLEKEWKEWLIRSKNRLQHRKDDLLKNLHRESPYSEKHHSNYKLNHPSINSFDDFSGEIFHHSAHHKDHQNKHFSPLDLEIFDKLLNHEHQKHEERMSLSHLLDPESKHMNLLDMMKSEEHKNDKVKEHNGNDLSFPMDSFDFQSAVPTHRLFLGEPSTISEMMDQDLAEDSEDESLPEDSNADVVAVPFTAAERLVWDWQAVALASAVAACLLFFAVVAGYSILHVRQWRRLKTNFDADVEEISAKMSLMSHSSSGSNGGSAIGSSAADAANTNLYLEKLLENKKTTSNIYTQKRPYSDLVSKVESPS